MMKRLIFAKFVALRRGCEPFTISADAIWTGFVSEKHVDARTVQIKANTPIFILCSIQHGIDPNRCGLIRIRDNRAQLGPKSFAVVPNILSAITRAMNEASQNDSDVQAQKSPVRLSEKQTRPKGKSTNIQAPEKHQVPSSEIPCGRLVFGAWIFSGAWMLELGCLFFAQETHRSLLRLKQRLSPRIRGGGGTARHAARARKN